MEIKVTFKDFDTVEEINLYMNENSIREVYLLNIETLDEDKEAYRYRVWFS
jgi:hypothetical protein